LTQCYNYSLSLTQELTQCYNYSLSLTQELTQCYNYSLSLTQELTQCYNYSLSLTQELTQCYNYSLSLTQELTQCFGLKHSDPRQVNLLHKSAAWVYCLVAFSWHTVAVIPSDLICVTFTSQIVLSSDFHYFNYILYSNIYYILLYNI